MNALMKESTIRSSLNLSFAETEASRRSFSKSAYTNNDDFGIAFIADANDHIQPPTKAVSLGSVKPIVKLPEISFTQTDFRKASNIGGRVRSESGEMESTFLIISKRGLLFLVCFSRSIFFRSLGISLRTIGSPNQLRAIRPLVIFPSLRNRNEIPNGITSRLTTMMKIIARTSTRIKNRGDMASLLFPFFFPSGSECLTVWHDILFLRRFSFLSHLFHDGRGDLAKRFRYGAGSRKR
jgi:hypothetical protein